MSKTKRPLARRILRVLLASFGAIVLVFALAIGWLHTSSGQNFVRAKVEAGLKDAFVGPVTLGDLGFTLFGELRIGKLSVKDDKGVEAVGVDEIRLAPAWGSLFGDAPVIERLKIKGVRVHVVQAADGTTNLDNLVKKKTPAKPGPKKSAKPAPKVRLAAFEIDDVRALVDRADGSRASFTLVHTDGQVTVAPASKGLDLDIPKFVAEVALDAPGGGGGLAVRKFETQASVHLVDRVGDVKLGPTKAEVEVVANGKPPRSVAFNLAPIEAHLAAGDLKVSLDKLLLGALALQGVEVHAHTENDALKGSQDAAIHLKVDAKELDGLLDKQVLASDVDIDARLSGPAEKIALDASIKSGGATIKIDGELDPSDRAHPGYVIKVRGQDIDTSKILGADITAPPVTIDSIALDVKGRGLQPAELDAEAKLSIEGVTVKDAKVDAIEADVQVKGGEITLKESSIRALGQSVKANGAYRLSDKRVHAEIVPSVKGKDAIAPLKTLGIEPKGPIAGIAIKDGDAKITIDGQAGAALHAIVDLKHVAIGGGRVDIEGDADLGPPPPGSEKKIALDRARATVRFEGLDASALAGKPLPVSATASGRVTFEGTAEDPRVDADIRIVARAKGGENPPKVAVIAIKAETKEGRLRAHVRADGERSDRTTEALATAEITAALEGGKVAPDGPIEVRVDIPRRKLTELASFVPREEGENAPPEGEVELHAKIGGTAHRPSGTFDLDLAAAAVGGATQHIKAHGNVHGSKRLGGPAVDIDAEAWLRDGSGEAPIKVHADVDTGGTTPGAPVAWALTFDVPSHAIETLPLPPDRKKSLEGVTGKVSAHGDLHGTRDDAFGLVQLDAGDVHKDDKGPLALHAEVGIENDKTKVDVRGLAKDTTFLTIGGSVGVAGKGLLAGVRQKKELDPDLDLAIDIPDSEIKNLAPLAPKLASLPGHVHGVGSVKGKPSSPSVKLALDADKYPTLDGHTGHSAIAVAGDRHGARAKVEVLPESGEGVKIEASLPLPDQISITNIPEAKASARADAVDLRSIVPALVLEGKPIDFAGRLDWEMDGTATLRPSLKGIALKAVVNGDLALTKGKISLLGSNRVLDGVELKIESDAHELAIKKLHVHEADAEKKDRTLDVTGKLDWEDLAPDHADLKIQARDWLLFGGDRLGRVDAPRGALSADVHVKGDLDGPIKTVDADVESLDLRIPDRFDRSHQPEAVSLGDVLDLKTPGVVKGKLPLPPPAEPVAKEKKEDVDEKKGWDITVRLKQPVHLQQAPLDLMSKGGVKVEVRPGARRVRGKLEMVSGSVMVGGKKHVLESGWVTFDEAHPEGWLELHFARKLAPETLRDMSLASSTGAVRIDMIGPVGKQKVSLRGAGGVVLFETLAVDNSGRERIYAAPGLPAGETIQLPRHDDILTLTFLSVNMPHFLFLDRVSGYADPYEDRASYGQLDHFEGTRSSESGNVRFKATSQPPRAGESSNALELDWMFWNTGRSAAGVGVRGGDRGGGGPGVFLELNSGD